MRHAVNCSNVFALAALVVGCAAPVHAQTTINPRMVRFRASSDHDTVGSNGHPVVSAYELEIYRVGATKPSLVLDLGKPGPEPDGYIVANFANLIAAQPFPGETLLATVVAIGPGGTSRSNLSNEFVFNTCGYTVSPAEQALSGSGGAGSFAVRADSACEWSMTTEAGWISLDGPTTGRGSAAFAFRAGPNMGAEDRTATIYVADRVVTVTQAGRSKSSSEPPGATPSRRDGPR
jgi:hypothetical protein